jgi:ubiquinone/menaquinone biosynthesis C-methylase UbiE
LIYFGKILSGNSSYPEKLFIWLSKCKNNSSKVLDCGTGNGQAAESLAMYFSDVTAIDKSMQQLQYVSAKSKVRYLAMSAENLSFTQKSFDLVTSASAVYWFELSSFL